MNYDLVIFDLDGTTLDTLGDLAAAGNYALSAHGFPTHEKESYRLWIGSGVRHTIDCALPKDVAQADFDAVLNEFVQYYAAHSADRTAPYDGIPELLRSLRAAGLKLALNSNKPDSAVQSLCALHFSGLMDCVLGERQGIPKKPAPDGVFMILNELNVSKRRALYVGDSDTDIRTAMNAGIDCAWVSWGFRHRDELGDLPVSHAFDTVSALRDFILY